jgi:hypothetical protein
LKRIEIKVDNTSNQEHGISTKICTNGAASVRNESIQTSVGLETGGHTSNKEQTAENICKVIDAESIIMKLAPEKANSTSQKTITEFLSEKESDVPPIPNTSVQFLIAWKKVRTNPQLRYLYLKVG